MRRVSRRWLRMTAGLAAGSATGLFGFAFVLAGGLALGVPLPAWRRRVRAAASRLAGLERARLARFLDGEAPASPVPGPAAFGYLAARTALALLGLLVLLSVLVGAAYASTLVWLWFFATADGSAIVPAGIGGLFLLFLAAHAVFAVASLENQLAGHFLGPSRQQALERRIEELAVSRAGVVEAVHDERRRIERDLHDGVQQRLVALGMLLGRARRHPQDAAALLGQAHREARQALTELREVAWRVYPAVLDEAGLHAALEAVAEHSVLPVHLDYRLTVSPGRAAETVAYFVVSEAVTNAVKHSGARLVEVRLGQSAAGLTVAVRDDGRGGADPAGSGLLGLARRAAALDGRLSVDSPPGGPTTILAELPCE